ncbi:MAG: 16S rRNA (cytosine(1402)-N(4))-methyltransferase RsmH [Oscillatoriales cyanobacterium SM2_2_1]|nr:16S rRNA (cytosine(1402)-N(4))-methyltransferase RsmH [Oscillatoriales cyanobacterium SM2_2_1]
MDAIAFHHTPVLPVEVLAALSPVDGGHYLDCTVGGGGHSRLILTAAQGARLTCLDRDEAALAAARDTLATWGDRVEFCHGNFASFQPPSEHCYDGILADLGVSSAQLDQPQRGFSFRDDGDLDMRMDRRQDLTAADVVNTYPEAELADVIFTYGEERYARRIAKAIGRSRPFASTRDLADTIAHAVPPAYRYGRIHPATRTFQALRIVVNQELDSLSEWLTRVPGWLKPHGTVVVISFHSLEDRLVKNAFRNDPHLEVITKKPITATAAEQQQNPRSRSAKLRVSRYATTVSSIAQVAWSSSSSP